MQAKALSADSGAVNMQVISSRCKDGENGLLVPVGDEKALTKAIKTVIDDRGKLDSMKQSCLSQDLSRFDEKNVYRTYEDLFETVYMS